MLQSSRSNLSYPITQHLPPHSTRVHQLCTWPGIFRWLSWQACMNSWGSGLAGSLVAARQSGVGYHTRSISPACVSDWRACWKSSNGHESRPCYLPFYITRAQIIKRTCTEHRPIFIAIESPVKSVKNSMPNNLKSWISVGTWTMSSHIRKKM